MEQTNTLETILDKDYSQSNFGDNPVVNLATGRLQYAFEDLTVGRGNYYISLSHVYNSKLNSKFAQKIKGLGNGWKLNLSQYLIEDHADLSGNKVIKYIDDTGEIYRFVQFDDCRYYNDKNAKSVLVYSNAEKYIVDGVGNKLYFNDDGYLSKSVSCQNDQIEKKYIYDNSKRLIEVYDTRTVKTTVAKSRIVLSYNESGLLSTMVSYGNFNKKLFGLEYKYDDKCNLIAVNQIAYNRMSYECMTKRFLGFEYDADNYLALVVNYETKETVNINYTDLDNRVSQVMAGVLLDDAVSIGTKDSAQKEAVRLGSLECGTLSKRQIVSKSIKTYQYSFNALNDTVAYKVNIKNVAIGAEESSITLSYFIDQEGRIVSNFENCNGNLKTLNKQGAQRTNLVSGVKSLERINGHYSAIIWGQALIYFEEGISRNKAEESEKHFEYSFWLKTNSVYDLLEAKLTYKFENESVRIETVYINGKARNAWQRVSLPIAVPTDSDGKADTGRPVELKLQFLANKEVCDDSFVINEIGFTPAPYTVLQFHINDDNYLPLQKSTQVFLEEVTGPSYKSFSKDFYFTENDIIATKTNKYARKYSVYNIPCFDVICNDGTKRIPNVKDINFCFTSGISSQFRTQTLLPAGNAICTYYTFGLSTLTTQTVGVTEDGKTSSATTIVDYLGKTLYEYDEYGLEKNYHYDLFGVLTKIESVDSHGLVQSVSHYSYDEEGRPLTTDDGLRGQSYVYDDFEQIRSVSEYKVNNDGSDNQKTGRKVENRYGVYRDKQIACAEYNGSSVVGQKQVTYKDGKVRTVSDGIVKYGAKHDLAANQVEYTQFDSADSEKETVLQKDAISKYSKNVDDIAVQSHTSEFFDGTGKQQYVSTDVDTYGRVQTISRSGANNAKYQFEYDEDLTESKFASKPISCHNVGSNESVLFNIDADGNTVGWQEKDLSSNLPLFTVRQVSDNATKYTFGTKEDYFAVTEYDSDKTLSPRVTGVKYRTDYHDSYDEANDLSICTRLYTYDTLGRLINKENRTMFRQSFDYRTMGSTSLITKAEFKNYADSEENGIGMPLVHQVEDIEYDEDAQVKSVKQTTSWSSFVEYNTITDVKFDTKKTFKYDNLHRLTEEVNTGLGVNKSYFYDKHGKLIKVRFNDTLQTISYQYNPKGQLSAVTSGSAYTPYSYDAYGNRTQKIVQGEPTTYSYNYGNTLVSVSSKDGTSNYEYNADGVRYKKTFGNTSTRYFLDGNRILGEDRTAVGATAKKLRYFYDKEGLMGLRYNNVDFIYVKDVFNNITMILYNNKRVCARYEYDVWGNCTVYDETGSVNTDPTFVGNINPFRWKSFYYDTETGLYYANGSYYDKETGLYLDAALVSVAFDNVFGNGYIDRSRPVCDNITELATNPFTIDFVTELHPDPTYDPEDGLPWWIVARNWISKALYDLTNWFNNLHWAVKLIVGVYLLEGAILLTLATGGTVGEVIGLLVQVAIGIGIGMAMYALGTLFSGNFSWQGLGNAALDAFLVTSAILFISSSVNAIKYACRSKPVTTAELAKETSIKDMSYSDMLPNEKVAYDEYSKHGWRGNYPGQERGICAGGKYLNKNNILPQSTYQEFDINPVINGIGRDGSRFVVSSDYVVYLTRNHYVSFYRIIP